ncbi:tail fiber assembly protein [Pseudomonas sp. NFXW11]|uniref:phage tail assembly chaperone n=1 Tax=Pseudomonas sp. NFXW11 TaxID=2819531 RepID=UPI003CF19D60
MEIYFFDAQTLGFLTAGYHGDVVTQGLCELSADEHRALLAGQAMGKRIVADKAGRPALVDLPPPPREELLGAERAWRDTRLAATDAVVMRHRDELEDGAATTLKAEQYTELQAYRRALRGWPESGEFPLSEHRPPVPAWLPSLTL